MRYQFVGRKTPHFGKTLWEIVGNLKNFGVGRLVKKSILDNYPELSFCKIIKVQVVPPPEKQFHNRKVIVWLEEVYRDRKLGVVCVNEESYIPAYQLIPKQEEGQYLERLQKTDPPVVYVKKYCTWPPLYKKLWESTENEKYKTIPKLKTVTPEHKGCKVVEEEEHLISPTCSLYKGKLTVEEMYKEIVCLKLKIKNHTQA